MQESVTVDEERRPFLHSSSEVSSCKYIMTVDVFCQERARDLNGLFFLHQMWEGVKSSMISV